MKIIKIVNLALIVFLAILTMNLLQPKIGAVVYSLDDSEPKCYFKNSEQLNPVPMQFCCNEIQKQLTCQKTKEMLDIKCSTSSTRYYLLNNKAFNDCRSEGYDVKIL